MQFHDEFLLFLIVAEFVHGDFRTNFLFLQLRMLIVEFSSR